MTKGDIALLKALRDTLDNMLFEPVLGITKKAMNQAITELEQIEQQPSDEFDVAVKSMDKLEKIEQIVDKWNNDASHSFSDMCKINGILKEQNHDRV